MYFRDAIINIRDVGDGISNFAVNLDVVCIAVIVKFRIFGEYIK